MNIALQLNAILQQYKEGEQLKAIDSAELLCVNYPSDTEIKKLLAKMYYLLGEFEQSIKHLENILKLSPKDDESLFNLSAIYRDLNKLELAYKYTEDYVNLRPSDYVGWLNLAELCLQLKNFELAISSSKKSLAINPNLAEAWNNIGLAKYYLKSNKDAIKNFDEALKIRPFFVDALSNKGNALKHLGELEEALIQYDFAIQFDEKHVEAYFNKANTLQQLKQYQSSIENYDRALQLKPDYAEAWSNKGLVLDELGRFHEALIHFDKALEIKADFSKAWSNKGMSLSSLRKFEEAIQCFNNCLALNPDSDFIFGEKLHTKMKICNWSNLDDEIKFCKSEILKSKPVIQPFSLLSLIDEPELHKKCSEIYVEKKYPIRSRVEAKNFFNKDKIRVAYLSADFHNHATSYLMAQLFEKHNREKFEVHGISFGPLVKDEMRERVSKSFDYFHVVNHLSNKEIVKLCRSIEIDIAIDLKGYTQDSRTEIFSCRAAPIQVSYLGYPGTMAAKFIDYIVADKIVIPYESTKNYQEKIIYLPGSYQVNDSSRKISSKIIKRSDFGLPENAFIFCCFNNSYKITPAIFDAWSSILKSVDESVLWLFEENLIASNNLISEAKKRGISRERIVFASRLPLEDHLARHQLADLFLDTVPYNAHTTASDALWANLPVLTCPGKSFASRVSASLLENLDLNELIAKSLEEYKSLAIFYAKNPHKLALVKNKLTKNKLSATLFNAEIFARNIEEAFEVIHSRHLENVPLDNVELS